MKIKDLILLLQQVNEDIEVVFTDYNGRTLPITQVNLNYNLKGNIELEME